MLRLLGVACLLAAAAAAHAADAPRLVLHTSTGGHAFTVEIADTEQERERGLMFRTALAPDSGMLFDFHEEQQTAFWMQNTLIPLDMIFIAANGVVRTIHANARPLDTTAIPSEVPVRYVLEIAGGRAREIGLVVGDRMDYPQAASSP